jgi:Peptidase family M23
MSVLDLERAVLVDPPVAGEWVALNTPAERVPSHGTNFFGQRYAFDFAQLNAAKTGFSLRPLWAQFVARVDVEQFVAWNQDVFAAFPGEVMAAEDGYPDRRRVNSLWEVVRANLLHKRPDPRDLRTLLGNHVLVEGEAGVALYAHLKKGSISVAKGEKANVRQRLGAVGNSGNSTMPHLHFQVMDRCDLWSAEGIPCAFRGCRATATAQGLPSATRLVPRAMVPFIAPAADVRIGPQTAFSRR